MLDTSRVPTKSVLLFLFASAAFAQFTNLATTDDGGQLYFSSPLRLKSGDVNFNSRILRYVGEFETFSEAAFSIPADSFLRTSYYRLTDPQVSGGGTVVAWTANAACTGGVDCQGAQPQTQSHIAGAVLPNKPDYQGIRLSEDGSRALMAYEIGVLSVVDLTSGSVTSLFPYGEAGDGRQAFANDGSVLLRDTSGGLLLWNAGVTTKIRNSRPAAQARVSWNGATIVYEGNDSTGRHLVAYDVGSGRETLLRSAPADPAASFLPTVTVFGDLVTYRGPDANGVTQAFLARSDGTFPRQITSEPEGISEVTISGFGNVIYAATPHSRLLRIDPVSGAVTELANPLATFSLSAPAPGSLVEIDGANLSRTLTVLVNGEAAPLLSANDAAIAFQIPWDTPTGGDPVTIRVIDTVGTPFEAGVYTQQRGPQGPFPGPLQAVNGAFLAAVHQGFSSLISASSPAIPGEVAGIYATGLGPVTGSMQTGVPAPVDGTLQYLQNPMTCKIDFPTAPLVTSVNAPVFFAGLAPGLVGIYQVNLQIPAPPANLGSDSPILDCSNGIFTPFSVAH